MKRFFITLWLAFALLPLGPVYAQSNQPTVYVVQAGDTLSRIAFKYDVTIAELAAENNLANPNLLTPGQKLVIPADDNAPATDSGAANQTYTVQPGDTMFAIAGQVGVRMARLAEANNITDVNRLEVGQVLIIPAPETVAPQLPLTAPFENITFSESRIAQGRTLVISVTLSTEAKLTAAFEDRPVMLSGSGKHYWGIVGIHALSEIGVYSVAFTATLPDGSQSAVAQNVVVTAGPYSTETIVVVPGREDLLDPEVVAAETQKMTYIWNQVTPQKQWDGPFRYPLDEIRITSEFGTRRSYGEGPVNGFHGGLDFGGSGVPIYAPAAGTVVLAEQLVVRGNAVLIDHGMGLFSGYWHQSEIAVHPGDKVAPGDLIGYVGDTGLVTGPHLHWEMRLGGIAVDPLQWVKESIP